MNKARRQQLQAIFRTEHRRLYIAALAITKQRTCAEDAVHDALVAVAEVSTEPDDLKAYLFRVVRNRALHLAKSQKRFNSATESDIDTDNFFEVPINSSHPERIIFAEQVNKHIALLDTNTQQVLIMKLYSDFTFDEIANITNQSPNTVASWYRRGLKQLKEMIHGQQTIASVS